VIDLYCGLNRYFHFSGAVRAPGPEVLHCSEHRTGRDTLGSLCHVTAPLFVLTRASRFFASAFPRQGLPPCEIWQSGLFPSYVRRLSHHILDRLPSLWLTSYQVHKCLSRITLPRFSKCSRTVHRGETALYKAFFTSVLLFDLFYLTHSEYVVPPTSSRQAP